MSRFVLILRSPQLKDLYRFWVGLCVGENPPTSGDLDPADLQPWLDNLVVLDVTIDGEDFIYAYYGQSFAAAFGASTVGKSVSELPVQHADVLKAEYEGVLRERMPVARIHSADFDGEQQTWERLVLPLFDDEGEVEKLLVAAYQLTESPNPAQKR